MVGVVSTLVIGKDRECAPCRMNLTASVSVLVLVLRRVQWLAVTTHSLRFLHGTEPTKFFLIRKNTKIR